MTSFRGFNENDPFDPGAIFSIRNQHRNINPLNHASIASLDARTEALHPEATEENRRYYDKRHREYIEKILPGEARYDNSSGQSVVGKDFYEAQAIYNTRYRDDPITTFSRDDLKPFSTNAMEIFGINGLATSNYYTGLGRIATHEAFMGTGDLFE